MPERLAYRVTEKDTELIRITEQGAIERVLERIPAPPAPPDWLQEVIRVRRSIGDPITSDFIYVEELPESALPNTAFTVYGDGRYWFFADGQWRQYEIKFSDAYIRQLVGERGRLRAAIRLIDNLIARIDPASYLVSGNAGGQTVSFPTLGDILNYYGALRKALEDEEAEDLGMNSGLMLGAVRRPVGGVWEEDER